MLGLLGDAQGSSGFKLVPSVRRENFAFLFVSKLAVAFCLVMVLVLGLSEYFGDRINCISTNNQAGAPSGGKLLLQHKSFNSCWFNIIKTKLNFI